jgi:hypothetical protein
VKPSNSCSRAASVDEICGEFVAASLDETIVTLAQNQPHVSLPYKGKASVCFVTWLVVFLAKWAS